MMGSSRRVLPPLAIAALDLGVGSLLYTHVSVLLGLLLLVCGLSVLIAVTYEPLVRVGTVLRRRFSGPAAE
jgi:hypothetical protein